MAYVREGEESRGCKSGDSVEQKGKIREELEVEKVIDKREDIENERRIDTKEKRKRNGRDDGMIRDE